MPLTGRSILLTDNAKYIWSRPLEALSPRLLACLRKMPHWVKSKERWMREITSPYFARAITSGYAYIVLWCFPLFYAARIESIIRDGDRQPHNHRNSCQVHGPGRYPRKWKKFLEHIVSISNAALCIGFSCICTGAYITQNSYESMSAMLGLVLLIQGLDALVNAFTIFLYAEVVAPHARLYNFKAEKDHLVARIAMVLAVPASSLVWCLFTAVVAVMVYSGQASAAQTDLKSFTRGTNTITNHHDQSSTEPSDLWASVEAHELSLGAQICVGIMAGLYIARSSFVLYSILCLREIDQNDRNNSEV